jgi:acyl carrier protein
MTALTPRQREILTKLRTMDWLRDTPAVMTRGADDEGLMAMTLGEDLGLDSLEVVALVVDIEDAFGIEIENDQIDGMETVRDAVQVIEGLSNG